MSNKRKKAKLKSRPKNKASKKQNSFSRVLSGSNNSEIHISRIFKKLDSQEILKNFNKISAINSLSDNINMTINHKSKLYGNRLPTASLISNINWVVGLIKYHRERIVKFIELESKLTKLIINNNYERSISCLDEIDRVCGVSTWSIGIRSTIIKKNKKNEHEEYIQALQKDYSEPGVPRFLIFNIKNRYDDGAVQVTKEKDLMDIVLRHKDSEMKSFLLYKVIPIELKFDRILNYENIFNIERDSSLIDCFKLLVNYCLDSFKPNKSNEGGKYAKIIIKEINDFLDYGIFKNLEQQYLNVDLIKINNKGLKIVDDYIVKPSANFYKKYQYDTYSKENLYIVELMSKSLDHLNFDNKYKANNFSKDISNILLKNSDFYKSRDKLLMTCHAYNGLPWFQELHYFVYKNSSHINKPLSEFLENTRGVFSNFSALRVINSLVSKKCQIIDQLKDVKSSVSLSVLFDDGMRSLDFLYIDSVKSFDYFEIVKSEARRFLSLEMYNDAIKYLETILFNGNKYIVNEIIQDLFDAYIGDNRILDALRLFSDNGMKDSNLIYLFDVEEVCKIAVEEIPESTSIIPSIVLSLACRFVDINHISALRFSFDQYLTNLNLSDPLKIIGSNINRPMSLYFLEYICTQDVMKLSFIFVSKKEVEDCRLSVCSYLINENVSKEVLVNEIKIITTEQEIRKGVSQIDRHRINSDISSFKDSRSKSFREVFSQYISIKEDFDVRTGDEFFMETLSKNFEGVPMSDWHKINVLNLPIQNVKNLKFYKLVDSLTHEFTLGEKGLNSYLSTRIRHGFLPNAFRKNVSKENLLSKPAKNKNYDENHYWKSELDLNAKDWKVVNNALSVFSTEYEEIISDINNNWLQITCSDRQLDSLSEVDEKASALFNYKINPTETYMLQRLLHDNTYDSFIKIITAWLWMRTAVNLEIVRNEILNTASQRIKASYSKLYESISNSTTNIDDVSILLDSVSRSRDGLNSLLKTVAMWFIRTEVDEIDEFIVDTAIIIAERSANIVIEKNIDTVNDYKIKGHFLSSFVDIFYILFENAVSKSNLKKQDLKINVLITNELGNLIIKVVNNCSFESTASKANKDLIYYNESIENGMMQKEVLQAEGGTGLFKISTILATDFKNDHSFQFYYNSDKEFEVIITMQEFNSTLLNK